MSDSAILSVDDMLVTYSDRISILKTSYLSQWQLSIRWQQLSNCCSTPSKYNHVCSDGFYSAKQTELPNHLKNLPKYTLVTKKNYQTYIGANCISPQMCVNSMYGIYLFQNCPYVCQYGYQYLCPWLPILLAIKLPTCPWHPIWPNSPHRSATPGDSGSYECQVSAEPKLSKMVRLDVQGKDCFV